MAAPRGFKVEPTWKSSTWYRGAVEGVFRTHHAGQQAGRRAPRSSWICGGACVAHKRRAAGTAGALRMSHPCARPRFMVPTPRGTGACARVRVCHGAGGGGARAHRADAHCRQAALAQQRAELEHLQAGRAGKCGRRWLTWQRGDASKEAARTPRACPGRRRGRRQRQMPGRGPMPCTVHDPAWPRMALRCPVGHGGCDLLSVGCDDPHVHHTDRSHARPAGLANMRARRIAVWARHAAAPRPTRGAARESAGGARPPGVSGACRGPEASSGGPRLGCASSRLASSSTSATASSGLW